jgi:hypothetical protein
MSTTPRTPATPTEPQTRAGWHLYYGIAIKGLERKAARDIIAIEAEAIASERERVRKAVEALPYSVVGVGTPPMVALDDAVDALKRFRDDVLSRLGERE